MATLTKTSKEIQESYNEYYNGYHFNNKAYEQAHIYIENKSKKYLLVDIKEISDKLEFTLAYREDIITIEYELSDKIKFDITDKVTVDYYNAIEKYHGVPLNIIQLIKEINIKDARLFDNDIMEIAQAISRLSDETKSYVYGWIDYISKKNDLFIMYPFAAQQVFYRFCLESDMQPMMIKVIPSYVWLIYATELEDYIEEEMVHYVDPYGILESKYRMMGDCIFYLEEEMQVVIADVMLSNIKGYVPEGIIPDEVAMECIHILVDAMSGSDMEEHEVVPGVTIH